MSDPDDGPYGPPAFMAETPENLSLRVNALLPGSSGGPIQATKQAIVDALREAIKSTAIPQRIGRDVYVELEYPIKPEQYPGIWVQFSMDSFVPAGLGQEVMTQVEVNGQNVWTPIQTYTYTGKISMMLVALTNLDRDQMADAIIMMMAGSRTPEVWVTQPEQDTKQYRSLLTELNENDTVSLTPNFATLASGGQGADLGAPWQPDVFVYTDSYSFSLLGQTQIQFFHDGAYTLSRVDFRPTVGTPPVPGPFAIDPIGRGVTDRTWRTL